MVVEAGNLVRNGDFSEPGIVTKPSPPITRPDHRIPKWELNGFWHAVPDVPPPFSGATVVEANASTSPGSLRQAIYLTPGKTYTLSAWVKADGLTKTDSKLGERAASIRVNNWKGTENIFLAAPSEISSEWTRYSKTFSAPAEYKVAGVPQPCFLSLYIPADESGRIWVTGFQLEEGDQLSEFNPVSLTDVRELKDNIATQEERIREAVDAVERFEGAGKEDLRKKLQAIQAELKEKSKALDEGLKLPMEKWRMLTTEVDGTLQLAHEITVPQVWWAEPWGDPAPRLLPASADLASKEVKMTLGINDYGAALLPITVLTQDALAAEVQVGEDPGPLSALSSFSGPIRPFQVLRVSNEGYFNLHSRVQEHQRLPHYLNPLANGNVITLPGQQTSQLWLDINTKGMKAGTYRYPVVMKALSGTFQWRGAVVLEVLPVELPDRVPANVIAFSTMPFFMTPINPHNRERNLTHLTPEERQKIAGPWLESWREMGFNRLLVTNQFLDVKFTPEGELAEPIDYSRMDALQNLYAEYGADFFGAYNLAAYHIFPEWKKAAKVGAPERARMKSLFTSMIGHFKELEIKPEQFPLCMFDEPYGARLEIARAGAEELKKVAPEWPVLSTAIGTERHHIEPMVSYVDIFVVRQRMGRMDMEPRTIAYLQRQGKEVWGYSCSGSFDYMHPYRYFRLLPWQAWQNNLTGYGTFMTLNAKQWDELGPRANFYSPVFFGRNGPVPGKGAKGLQRGGRDWCLFVMAREKAEQMRKNGDEGKAAELRQLLASSVANVLKDEDNTALADQSRDALLRALVP